MSGENGSKRGPRRVLVHGLDYFGPALAEFLSGDGWEFRYYSDRGLDNLIAMSAALQQSDLVYQIGGRVTIGKFLFAAKLLGKRRIVMHWTGTDTLDVLKAAAKEKTNPWVLNGIHHWTVSEWIHEEVTNLGIKNDFVPLPSTKTPSRPSLLPQEFSVLVYLPLTSRSALYGLDMILEVARKLPQIPFELVGLRDGPVAGFPPNIRVHNRLQDMTEVYQRASVVWRPTRHDGLSWMVLESLGHGRHVLWTYPFTGCLRATSAAEGAAHIERLFAMHQRQKLSLNEEGAQFIATSEYSPDIFKCKIRSRFQKLLES